MMQDYKKLVAALRICSSELNCGDCPLLYKDSCSSDELMADAAAAIEALQAEVQKRGEWNNHDVACLLGEMFGDDCACNLNGIDEWLPQYCEFAETCCPNPGGVSCWEQFLKHRAKMEVQE